MGCDGELGSGSIPDVCGVCGGDGSTCVTGSQPPMPSKDRPYVWEETTPSECSVSCGVGNSSVP